MTKIAPIVIKFFIASYIYDSKYILTQELDPKTFSWFVHPYSPLPFAYRHVDDVPTHAPPKIVPEKGFFFLFKAVKCVEEFKKSFEKFREENSRILFFPAFRFFEGQALYRIAAREK